MRKLDWRLLQFLFITGVPRSGTTLIANQLGGWPNACYLPKSLRALEKVGLGRSFELAKLLATWARDCPRIESSWAGHDGGGKKFWKAFKDMEKITERRSLLFSAAYPDAAPHRIFINKRIENVNQLNFLAETVPESVLLHVKRNPIDVIASILNRRLGKLGSVQNRWGVQTANMPGQNPDATLDVAMQYRLIYEQIEQQGVSFRGFHSVHYEKFCEDPAAEINRSGIHEAILVDKLDARGFLNRNKSYSAVFADKVLRSLAATSSVSLAATVRDLRGLYDV